MAERFSTFAGDMRSIDRPHVSAAVGSYGQQPLQQRSTCCSSAPSTATTSMTAKNASGMPTAETGK